MIMNARLADSHSTSISTSYSGCTLWLYKPFINKFESMVMMMMIGKRFSFVNMFQRLTDINK